MKVRMRSGLLAVGVLASLSFSLASRADTLSPTVREAAFADGGDVILDANVGDVHIKPTDHAGTLRLVIKSENADDAAAAPHWVREFTANGSQAKVVLEMPKHGQHHVEVTLFVPKQSGLKVNLEVGNLEIGGITGNVDAELGVGNLDLQVPDPHAYRAVAMSVRIGNVDAKAFGLEPSGFLGKSVDKDFGTGQYRLKLHTGVGNVSCVAANGA